MKKYSGYHLLSTMVCAVSSESLSSSILDFIIKTKYQYLLVINHERDAHILIEVGNYQNLKYQNGVYYLYTKTPILINHISPINTFEIDLTVGDDIIGCSTYLDVLAYLKESGTKLPLNMTGKTLTSKLIFSPQLANYLIDHGFHLLNLKEHKITHESIFVFAVEPGFYETIADFRALEKK